MPFRLNWPARYSVDDVVFPPHLVNKINQGGKLNRPQRSTFITAIVNDVFKYTYYPTSKQYNQIVDALLKRFPMLKGSSNGGTFDDNDATVMIF